MEDNHRKCSREWCDDAPIQVTARHDMHMGSKASLPLTSTPPLERGSPGLASRLIMFHDYVVSSYLPSDQALDWLVLGMFKKCTKDRLLQLLSESLTSLPNHEDEQFVFNLFPTQKWSCLAL